MGEYPAWQSLCLADISAPAAQCFTDQPVGVHCGHSQDAGLQWLAYNPGNNEPPWKPIQGQVSSLEEA
jgi:hypothetical protein